MSQDAMLLANAKRLSTDLRTVTIAGKAVDVHLQKVLVMPSADGSDLGSAPSGMLDVRLLDSGGTLDGCNVDGSVTPQLRYYQVPANVVAVIEEVHLILRDSAFIASTSFGAATALANGVELRMTEQDGTTQLYDFLAGGTWKANREIVHLADSVSFPFTDTMVAIFKLRRGDRTGVALAATQRVQLRIRDNLTSLDEFRVAIRGRVYSA